ncbi:restriction endonuclease [Sporosarcina ureae]|uniref:restriction endonuclease n=1 Tax=Sporosarcina ureae TaxID=1571 RepID=UPI0035E3FB9E
MQSKRNSSKVGNSAIQEVVAGLLYDNCLKGLIVINNYFTVSAEKLAYKNNVMLWNRDVLKIKFKEYYN